jgi:hypothetical protein
LRGAASASRSRLTADRPPSSDWGGADDRPDPPLGSHGVVCRHARTCCRRAHPSRQATASRSVQMARAPQPDRSTSTSSREFAPADPGQRFRRGRFRARPRIILMQGSQPACPPRRSTSFRFRWRAT